MKIKLYAFISLIISSSICFILNYKIHGDGDSSISYSIGSAVGTILISLIIAYIVFLITKKNNSVASIVLVAVSMVSLMDPIKKAILNTPYNTISKSVAIVNKGLPKKVDDVTTLKSVHIEKSKLVYSYEISKDFIFELTDENKNIFIKSSGDELRKTAVDLVKMVNQANLIFHIRYFQNDKIFLEFDL